MWELWRNHDVYEPGTPLAVSATGADGYHAVPYALQDGEPAEVSAGVRGRALPDGEIVAGTPIPALVPLPGKAMPVMPGAVTVVPKISGGVTVGSVAKIDRTDTDPSQVHPTLNPTGLRNPGYPFWIAGVEDAVGQRFASPPLDMATAAGGWDGGLPRHALDGYAASGCGPGVPRHECAHSVQSRLDLTKEVLKAKPIWYPEDGTDVEKAAMAFHAVRNHSTTTVNLDGGARRVRHQRLRPPRPGRAVPRAVHRRRGQRARRRRHREVLLDRRPRHHRELAVQRRQPAPLQGHEHPVRRRAEQARLPLPAGADHHAVGGRDPHHHEAAAARAARDAPQHVPLRDVREQARVLADFAAGRLGPARPPVAVVHAADPRLEEAAAAARAQLEQRGFTAIESVGYAPGALPPATARDLAAKGVRAVIFLGDDAAFAALAGAARDAGWTPDLLLPGALVARAALEAPRELQGHVFLAYPTLPVDEKPEGRARLAKLAARGTTGQRAAVIQADGAATVLLEALRRTGRAVSRRALVARLEALYQFDPGLLPQLTFGPSRRVGALGAYLVGVDLEERTFRPVGGWQVLE
jgi:hypothetical protein